jgi:hypothetical protein
MRFSLSDQFSKLQVLRLAHAIAEAGGTWCVAAEHAPTMKHLSARFPLSWEVGSAPQIPVEIDHSLPRTAVGEVQRALVFPHAAFTRCRANWAEERDMRITFAGLLTKERLATLSKWSAANGGKRLTMPGRIQQRFRSHILLRGLPSGTTVWASRRGRTYPVKAWDDDYFEMLGRSQFILCPAGDCVWTYRVFEAALCGAIPIVEEASPAYGDIRTQPMTADASALVWDREIVEHNCEEAQRLLTAPHEDLRSA